MPSRLAFVSLSLLVATATAFAQAPNAVGAKPDLWPGPADAKAQRTFEDARSLEQHHHYSFAIESYRKADKQDGNHCAACVNQVLELATASHDFKAADAASQELIGLASTPTQKALAHVERAEMLRQTGKAKKKPECFAEGVRETESALEAQPNYPKALYVKGLCLAEQQQDEAARQIFAALLPKLATHSIDHDRVSRYAERPELVRARMAPAFGFTALDGKHVSFDELHDKVVLIDFWATWCGPCREALPHLQRIAKQFEGQPLVIVSVSLDSDEQKWKDFVSKNSMTWIQVRDGSFNGPIAQLFEVRAIPSTFTIDSDGVLQDEHVGDAHIEGKLKKLITSAQQQSVPTTEIAAESSSRTASGPGK